MRSACVEEKKLVASAVAVAVPSPAAKHRDMEFGED